MAWSAGEILTAANLNTYLPQAVTTWSSPFAGGVTVGSGTTTAQYTQVGKIVTATLSFVFGAGSAITGAVTLTLPVTAINALNVHGVGFGNDVGTAVYKLGATPSTTTVVGLQVFNQAAGGTFGAFSLLSSTVPFTWGSGDSFAITLTYLAA